MVSIHQIRKDLIDEVQTGTDFYGKFKIEYPIFTHVPEKLKLTEKDVGKNVWVAGESRSTTVVLIEYKNVGDDNFPDGGFVCRHKGEAMVRSYYKNQVILHPDEVKKSKEQLEYEAKVNMAKKEKYKNPITGRMCSYGYSLREGFITDVGDEIKLEDMKFENPETGRMVSYNYAKQKGII